MGRVISLDKGVARAAPSRIERPEYVHERITEKVVRNDEELFVVQKSQDVGKILDSIKREKVRSGGRLDPDFYLAGRVPTLIVEDFLKRKGVRMDAFINDKSLLRELLNSPEYKAWRVWEGRF